MAQLVQSLAADRVHLLQEGQQLTADGVELARRTVVAVTKAIDDGSLTPTLSDGARAAALLQAEARSARNHGDLDGRLKAANEALDGVLRAAKARMTPESWSDLLTAMEANVGLRPYLPRPGF